MGTRQGWTVFSCVGKDVATARLLDHAVSGQPEFEQVEYYAIRRSSPRDRILGSIPGEPGGLAASVGYRVDYFPLLVLGSRRNNYRQLLLWCDLGLKGVNQ